VLTCLYCCIIVISGVPQGSVLSPCLFLFYINDIADGLKSTVHLFADDTMMYLTVKSRDANETFSFETETFESLFETRPRRDLSNFPRDRDVHFGFKTRPRPRPSFPRPRRFLRRYKRHTLLSLRLLTGTNYAVFPSL